MGSFDLKCNLNFNDMWMGWRMGGARLQRDIRKFWWILDMFVILAVGLVISQMYMYIKIYHIIFMLIKY